MNIDSLQQLFLDLSEDMQDAILETAERIEDLKNKSKRTEEMNNEPKEEDQAEYEDFFGGLEEVASDYIDDINYYDGIVDKGQYLSEIIDKDYIRGLTNESIELISSNTGTGKSTFAKEQVAEVAKERGRKVLILSHRRILKDSSNIDSIKREHGDYIDDITYHKIINGKVNLSQYEFIICDEIHFLLKDSCFINFTDDILYKLLRASKNYDSKIIMMTATPRGLIDAIHLKTKVKINHFYELTDRSFPNINKAYLGYNRASMEIFIDEQLSQGKKGIVYINNKETLLELFLNKKYRDKGMFICSKYSGRQYTRYMEEDKILELNNTQEFPEDVDIIFTTGILSDGVNIKDKQYRFLAMKEFSETAIIQTIGRKRIDRSNDRLADWEKLDVFFMNYNGNQFHKDYIEKLENRLKVYIDYHKMDSHDFYKKYRKTTSLDNKSIYLSEEGLTYNEFNIMQAKLTLTEIYCIKKAGFKEYIKKILGGVNVETIKEIKRLRNDEELLETLESIKNTKLYTAEDKEVLIQAMDVRRNGRQLRSMKVLNAALEEADLDYRIEKCKREDKIINGERKYFNGIWRVIDTTENIESLTDEKKAKAKEYRVKLTDDLLHRKYEISERLGEMEKKNISLLTKKEKDFMAKFINATYNGSLIKSISKLNKTLELIGVRYRFETFATSRMVGGKKRSYNAAWRVVKVK